MTLEETLSELEKLAEVLMWTHGNGWVCQASLRTTKPGADFKVSSDHRMSSPLAAAKQCLERITSD